MEEDDEIESPNNSVEDQLADQVINLYDREFHNRKLTISYDCSNFVFAKVDEVFYGALEYAHALVGLEEDEKRVALDEYIKRQKSPMQVLSLPYCKQNEISFFQFYIVI